MVGWVVGWPIGEFVHPLRPGDSPPRRICAWDGGVLLGTGGMMGRDRRLGTAERRGLSWSRYRYWWWRRCCCVAVAQARAFPGSHVQSVGAHEGPVSIGGEALVGYSRGLEASHDESWLSVAVAGGWEGKKREGGDAPGRIRHAGRRVDSGYLGRLDDCADRLQSPGPRCRWLVKRRSGRTATCIKWRRL